MGSLAFRESPCLNPVLCDQSTGGGHVAGWGWGGANVCVCVFLQNNMVPGISAAPSVARRAVAVECQREDSDIVNYTREMARTLEPQALVMGKRLIESMERRDVFPRYVLFIVVIVDGGGGGGVVIVSNIIIINIIINIIIMIIMIIIVIILLLLLFYYYYYYYYYYIILVLY
jgi:hypothetical protein